MKTHFNYRPYFQLYLLMLTLIAFILTLAARDKDQIKVLFISGKDTHGWGVHDHSPGIAILAESLKQAMGDKVVIHIASETWPSKQDFENVDTCVIYSDGWNRSVIKGADRTKQIESFMNTGKGVLRIHWATGSSSSDKTKHRALFGGNMENNYSVHSTLWHQKFALGKHPITRGMQPFELVDECYFYMHWKDEDQSKVSHILTAKPDANFKARSITPKARASIHKGEPQTIAWAYERPSGGRAFSYTGGHYHWDWANDNARKMIHNAIVWTAGYEVPTDGIKSTRPTAKRMLNIIHEKGQKKNPGWTADQLQPLLDKLNEPGNKIDWRKPPL